MATSGQRKLLIDTDAGVDDAQAILMALKSPDVDVIGITCVAGNVDAMQVGKNVLRVLQVVNRLDIPVYIGCNEALLGDEKESSDYYHGSDGLGDVPDPEAPDKSLIQSEHAVNALIRLSKKYKGELSLVCLAPLTNIAMGLRLDPGLGPRLKHCYIMGGNHHGKGNITVAAEFNFYFDPEAAYVVLNQLKAPITIVTWETCMEHSIPWVNILRYNNLFSDELNVRNVFDAGVDDAQAILMALKSPDVDVIGITCVAGNVDAMQVGKNVLRVLQVVNRLDIPVYIGCNEALLGDEKESSDYYHGSDGLGDVPDPEAPDKSLIQSEHAVNALIRLSKKYKGELSLVCLAPLTNIAMGLRLDPGLGPRLKHCYIMGGNHHGKGNITVAAEFNFYFDPEAAYVVLNQLKAPITIVTWETCMEHSIPWECYFNLRDKGGDVCKFLSSIEKKSCEYAQKQKWTTFISADVFIISCFLRPDVIKTCCDVYATVELKGQYTTGQMVVDWQKALKRPSNVRVVTKINQDLFEGMLEDLFKDKNTHQKT
ncbi:pyrimidine-specific ribonucleoside hydrolase RihA-like [Mya arenaria]|uniref:pyrimidine-specific ribonucleoside hydrolase RihA-like n=1 Tax=Mya arenaria TaxID=6604 RepID=UPI0022E26171|nr:pyrimidine-specific ribonucleoside hydrolase RihA-like [Mya arenaria]